MNNTGDLWIDTRLSEEEMKFLNDVKFMKELRK